LIFKNTLTIAKALVSTRVFYMH